MERDPRSLANLVRRALAGHHPRTAQEVMTWLGAAAAGWNADPTPFAWGYGVAARADYSIAFGTPLTLSPRVAFNHAVNGTTPGPGGNFLEDRKSLTLGVEANYLNQVIFDLSYTQFMGAEKYNQIHDRDFASFTVKYSF